MIYIETGRGKLPLITLVAIMSVSLVVNLPGLAISPLMDILDSVFPSATELEIQLLTILPNLFIIPFVLVSGHLSLSNNKILILMMGLIVYLLSAILYLFAQSMFALIVISCLLGIGCGMVIPLSAGLIAEYFEGSYRMRQLGVKSGLANFTLIFATLFVGWLGTRGWHLPFLVYLVPVIPFLLIPYMTKRFIDRYAVLHVEKEIPQGDGALVATTDEPGMMTGDFHFQGTQSRRLLIGVIILYFLITYGNMVVSYFLPFTMQQYRMSSTAVGFVTSLYFLAITIPGFFLPHIVHLLRNKTSFVSVVLITIGIFLLGIYHTFVSYMISVFLIGFGYGILQPIIYDKATYIAPNHNKLTQYLSFVLSSNYIAITISPFIVKGLMLLSGSSSDDFPYYLNASVMFLLAIGSLIFCKSFVFRVLFDKKLIQGDLLKTEKK